MYIEIFVREIYRKIQASYSDSSIYKGIYLQMENQRFRDIFS